MNGHRSTLLRRVRGRKDPQVWQEFLELYRPIIRRYCRLRGLPEAVADEVTRSCIDALKAYVEDPAFFADRRAFREWLFNLVLERVESRAGTEASRDPRILRQASAPLGRLSVQRDLALIWRQEHLRHCLHQLRLELDETDYQAFHHLVLDGWSAEEVCDRYSLSRPAFDLLRTRLARRLRRLLDAIA